MFKFTPLAGYILKCVGISSTDINQYYLAGVFGFISRLGIKGVFECIIEYYTIKDKIGDNSILPHSYDRDPLGNSQHTNFAKNHQEREETPSFGAPYQIVSQVGPSHAQTLPQAQPANAQAQSQGQPQAQPDDANPTLPNIFDARQIEDPKGQFANYDPLGINQPAMGNLRLFLLNHSLQFTGVPLSQLNLTTDQKDFILKHLRKVSPEFYNRLDPTGNNQPKWSNIRNTKRFRYNFKYY